MPISIPEGEPRALVRRFLTEPQERALLGLLATHDTLMRALETRLLAAHRLSLSAFETLIAILHAEGAESTITELAHEVRLSPSRVSRLVAELEGSGLVERRRSAADSRATSVSVTERGWERVQEAAPAYLETSRAILFDRLSPRDIDRLARIWDRLRVAEKR